MVISNHPDHAATAKFFGVPYHYLPVADGARRDQERAMTKVITHAGVDLIVLARYMQILSDDFIDRYPGRIVNIHHSFLPAFVGSRPYHQAHARGVKVLGVTTHYATAELDEGPIIDQDVVRIQSPGLSC